MGSLSEALAAPARPHGAPTLPNRPVAGISVEGGRATGVVLEDGTTIRARLILSNADPKVTFLTLLPRESLPADFRHRISTMDFSSSVTKINVALDPLPTFTARPGPAGGPHPPPTIPL